MVQISVSEISQSAVTIETTTAELLVDGGAVDVSGTTRQSLVETAALSRFTMLVSGTRLVLDSIVDRLADPTFALPAGASRAVNVKELKRFQGVA